MPRAKHVRPSTEESPFDYPGPEEFNEPSNNFDDYMITIYGPKGSGKTTAIADFPDSLTLQAEPMRKGLRIRQVNLQKHTAKEIMDGAPDLWKSLLLTTQNFLDDDSITRLNYDSIDIYYESCYHSVCASNKVQSPASAGKGGPDIWNEIRDEFASYFDTLKDTHMGITFTSHVKEREEATLDGGKMGYAAPSCSPACLKYIKQAVDIVLFYGWYNGYRAMMVRDDTNASFVAPGVEGKFLQPDGKPIYIFQVPDKIKEPKSSIYTTIKAAFNNQLWDIDTPEEDRITSKVMSTSTPKKGPPTNKVTSTSTAKKGPPKKAK